MDLKGIFVVFKRMEKYCNNGFGSKHQYPMMLLVHGIFMAH